MGRQRTCAFSAAIAIALCAPAARADDPRAHLAARDLGAEGIKLYEQKKYAEALDRFQRADKLVPAPTLELRIARSLEKLGRLVEASETYLQAVRFKNPPFAPPAHLQAEKDAQTERDLLMPRIPKVRVVVTGPQPEPTTVLLDGRPLQRELLDTLVAVDPGKHEVRVRREDTTVVRTATVAEGGNARIEVQLPPLPETPAEKQAKSNASAWRAGVITAWTVGGAGLLAFAINGGVALAQHADLAKRCPDGCPPDAFGELGVYNVERVATTVGLVIGGVGVAAGATLLALKPKPADARPAFEPSIGPGGAALRLRW